MNMLGLAWLGIYTSRRLISDVPSYQIWSTSTQYTHLRQTNGYRVCAHALAERTVDAIGERYRTAHRTIIAVGCVHSLFRRICVGCIIARTHAKARVNPMARHEWKGYVHIHTTMCVLLFVLIILRCITFTRPVVVQHDMTSLLRFIIIYVNIRCIQIYDMLVLRATIAFILQVLHSRKRRSMCYVTDKICNISSPIARHTVWSLINGFPEKWCTYSYVQQLRRSQRECLFQKCIVLAKRLESREGEQHWINSNCTGARTRARRSKHSVLWFTSPPIGIAHCCSVVSWSPLRTVRLQNCASQFVTGDGMV